MRATGPAFVGREPERAAIEERLRAARDGAGQVVLIAGEPGAGKTRLAEEAADRARALGLRVAGGRATEDEGSPPYWPFLQVFRALGQPPPEELVPPDGAAPDGGSPQRRFRLFEAVTDALVAGAEPGGLVVLLDDLQWADAASARLLVHLAAALSRSRLMVLATYRDTETVGQEALRTAIAALAREPAAMRLRLAGLSEVEVAEHLAGITGWSVPPSVAAAVHRRTEGNPFFVGELGRRLASTVDSDLPAGVREAVRDRLGRLSAPNRSLIAAAAVLGSDVDTIALAQATGSGLDAVLAAVDEAVAAGIVVESRRFAHDLFREAARLELPTAERLALHRRMAEHLCGRDDRDTRAAEIAHHWLEALPTGDPAEAVAWAERAAERAMAQYAWEESAALYQRALAAGRVHQVIGPADQCRLLLAIADAQVRSFSVAEARQTLVDAAAIARAQGDAESVARAALTMEGVSDYEWDPIGRQLCTEALETLPAGDSALRARVLAMLVSMSTWEGPDLESSAQALAMAERLGDRRALREALRARQMAVSGPDGAPERLALGDRMVALGVGDDDTLLWGRLWRFDALVQLGDLDGAEAELPAIAAVAQRLRSPAAAWHSVRCRSAIAGARGRLDEALAHALEAERLARRAGVGGALLPSQATLVLYRLMLGEPGEFPAEHRPPAANPVAGGFLSTVYAFWLLATGERAEARRLFRSAVSLGPVPPMVALPALAWMIEFAAEFDDRDIAADCYRSLLPHADLLVCGGAGIVVVVGTVQEALGLAAATLGHLDDAARHLRAAIALAERIGMPPAVASSTHHLARVLARRRRPGDREEASALATAAAARAERLGMRPVAERARELAATLAGQASAPLTRREDEIATLVAQGLTNRQIAAAAHISERTAETHVQHIMDKLGFGSRTQIAVWVAGGRGGVRDRR